jgi:DNA-binding HxlR family transcriptional regulator
LLVTTRRSDCPIACTLDILGDKWTLLVLRDLFFGARYFDDFAKGWEGIATNILGDRLRKLERDGLVSRTRDEQDGRRVRYALTARGESLKPVLTVIARWGMENIENTRSRLPLEKLYAKELDPTPPARARKARAKSVRAG